MTHSPCVLQERKGDFDTQFVCAAGEEGQGAGVLLAGTATANIRGAYHILCQK